MQTLRIVASTVVLLAIHGYATTGLRVELRLKRAVTEAVIEQEFLDRATPGSAKYMQHLSVREVAELHRPVNGAQAAVKAFLEAAGGTPNSNVLAFSVLGDAATLSVAPKSITASRLGLAGSPDQHVAAVPAELIDYVEQIVVLPAGRDPTHIGSGQNAFSASSLDPSAQGMDQNPITLYQRYDVPNSTLATDVVQGVSEFRGTGFSQRAMDRFNEYYGLPKTQVKIGGPPLFSVTGWGPSEGQLDVEYIAAMAPNATTWWIGGNVTPNGFPWWSEWCDTVLGLRPLPEVISISWFMFESQLLHNQSSLYTWGATPTSPPSTMPAAMAIAEDGFRKLALAGITVVVASGDSGPNSWLECGGVFNPIYPASSQYVLSVGATYASSEHQPEASVSWSGGGFSWWVPQPAWQKEAVNAYVAADHPGMAPSWKFNAKGRAYPDVAALGTNYALLGGQRSWYTSGPWSNMAGTSASAPTFAGILSRIVAERKAKGKGSLGCIAPTLYQLGKVGHDVALGQTGNGCDFDTTVTSGVPPNGFGFPAVAGWDAATGLGTPNYTYLVSQLA